MSAQMRPAERLARYFHCTKCGAQPGRPCVKQPSGQPTMHHAARRNAVSGELKPGDVIRGDSGAEYVIGEPIGLTPEPGSECDSDAPASYVDGHCRCVVCARCRHHTGNAHQGHYWAYCKVKRGIREFHFCCPDPAYGCELEET